MNALDLDMVRLVDHHVHGVTHRELPRREWESRLTESQRPIPGFASVFDSQLGLAIRRYCAPVLDLPPHCTGDAYVARRRELGVAEVTRRLLQTSGVEVYVVDTGYGGQLPGIPGTRIHEVVRIESVMAEVATAGVSAGDFPDAFRQALQESSQGAVGLKSILAYRHGLDIDPERPSDAAVVRAASTWLSHPASRLADPVLLRFGLWCAVDRGLPLQIHTGFGDPDLDLSRSDPSLLTPWLRATQDAGTDVLLLHCYPFHRNAGYLAHVFPHVYLDVGLAIHHTGLRSDAVIAESVELAPFSKVLFSSDGCGPAELHFLGATLWRRGMSRLLSEWIAAGECEPDDALRIARLIGRDNARRVYGL